MVKISSLKFLKIDNTQLKLAEFPNTTRKHMKFVKNWWGKLEREQGKRGHHTWWKRPTRECLKAEGWIQSAEKEGARKEEGRRMGWSWRIEAGWMQSEVREEAQSVWLWALGKDAEVHSIIHQEGEMVTWNATMTMHRQGRLERKIIAGYKWK